MRLDALIFVLWMLSFKPAFSLSSFTFFKRFFSYIIYIGLIHFYLLYILKVTFHLQLLQNINYIPSCTIHPWACLISNSLFLLLPTPVLPLPTTGNHQFSVSVSLPFFLPFTSLLCFLDFTCKWHHIPFVFSLIYFTKHNVLQVHPHCWIWKKILFYDCVLFVYMYVYVYIYITSSLSIHLLMDT